MVVVSYHDDLKEVQGAERLPAAAPFDRAEWFAGLHDQCGLEPLFAAARKQDRLVVLPLQIDHGHVRALTNWYTFRWEPLGRPDPDLLTRLAADLRGRAWRLSLAPLPDEAGEASALAAGLAAAGWRIRRTVSDTNHVLEVAGRTFAQYLATRPGTLRTTLKRKSGKVAVELLTHFDPAAWAAYEEVYAASWKPEEGAPAFLRAFAEAEGAAGRLRMALARHEGKPVAAQFWTVEGGTAWIHKLAHREDAKALSPGTTLTAALLEQVMDRDRVDLVDFGTGDDSYKRDWMEETRQRFRIEAFNPASPRAWPHLLRNLVRRPKHH